jgi:hypothetical protein
MASEGRGVAASALEGVQDLYQEEETLKKLCQFSNGQIGAILLKCPYFVFHVFSQNKYKCKLPN